MPELHILPTPEATVQAAAEFVASLAEKQGHTQGRFTIALAGGSTPRRLYQVLASPAYKKRIAWERWHLFWGDERCVPPYHKDSNYRMAKEAFLDGVQIPSDQIHRIRGETNPQDASEEYERELRRGFLTDTPIFDLILLGMGEDGHTASLFPGTDALYERQRLIVANWIPHLHAFRVTFTLPLINAARAVAFLATDGSKADALKKVLHSPSGNPLPPAALVCPVSENVHWFLTKAVAARIEGVGV